MNYKIPHTFHFESEEEALACIYDSTLFLLNSSKAIIPSLSKETRNELKDLCAMIQAGQKIIDESYSFPNTND